MKPNEKSVQTFDDILFENRNQAYGAYAIRKSYDSNVNRAASIVRGMAIIATIRSIVLPKDQIPTPDQSMTIGCTFGDFTIIPVTAIIRRQPAQANRRENLPPKPVAFQPDATEMNVPVESGLENSGTSTGSQTEAGDFGPVVQAAVPLAPTIPAPRKVYDHVEVPPSYAGGLEAMAGFIRKHVKYPAIARRTEVEGIVYVQFVLNAAGRITEAKVLKGVSPECDKEALRVISMMPSWNPGLQGGTPVMVRMVLPIRFKLN
ncbi:MAG: TonB family protein [Chryseolinea sp.]